MLDKPDMHKDCAHKLIELAKSANIILEWGSGGSTIVMSKIMRLGAVLYSWEHNKKFYDMVEYKIDRRKVVYAYAPEKDRYINGPAHSIHYSFILVDGIYRKECMERARNNLSWDRLLLHDAERKRYKPYMDAFGDEYKKYFVRNLWICEKRS